MTQIVNFYLAIMLNCLDLDPSRNLVTCYHGKYLSLIKKNHANSFLTFWEILPTHKRNQSHNLVGRGSYCLSKSYCFRIQFSSRGYSLWIFPSCSGLTLTLTAIITVFKPELSSRSCRGCLTQCSFLFRNDAVEQDCTTSGAQKFILGIFISHIVVSVHNISHNLWTFPAGSQCLHPSPGVFKDPFDPASCSRSLYL